jgi:DNA-binding winged helix-turn-helix (wHTH) protein
METHKRYLFRHEGAEFCYDSRSRRLMQGANEIELEKTPREVLKYLLDYHDRLIEYKELKEAVWGRTHVENASIHTAINKINTALRKVQPRADFIKTSKGEGVRFLAAVDAVEVSPGPPSPPTPPPESDLDRATGATRQDWTVKAEPPAMLAHGDDRLELKFIYKDSNEARHSGTYVSSWNHIFAVMGPYMVKPSQIWSSEAQLRAEIISWLNKGEIKDFHFHLAEETRNSIKVQFLALGLIEISETEYGHETWKLTPFGVKRLLASEAARRQPAAQVATKSASRTGRPTEQLVRRIDNLLYALEHFHSNPEGVFYIGQTLIECVSFLEDCGALEGVDKLIEELVSEVDNDERAGSDPKIPLRKVRQLISYLKDLKRRYDSAGWPTVESRTIGWSS